MHDWYNINLDGGAEVQAVFFDLQKAFDTVPGPNQSNERYTHDLRALNLWLQLSFDWLASAPFCSSWQTLAIKVHLEAVHVWDCCFQYMYL